MTAIFYLENLDLDSDIEMMDFKDFKLAVSKEYQDGLLKKKSWLLNLMGESNDRDWYLNLAKDVIQILSLATGKDVYFDKQKYDQDIVRKTMVKPTNEGLKVIPNFEIETLFKQSFQTYITLSENMKKTIFVTTNLINQTKNGFLDDRVFKSMQAWETLLQIKKVKIELPENLRELKRDITQLVRKWKNTKENKELDKVIQIGSRLNSCFNNEILISKLQKLISGYNFRFEEFGLDFRKLKKLRDEIAHTGYISNIATNMEKKVDTVFHLNRSVKALQLLLLRDISYTGLVIDQEKGWIKFNKMDTYFNHSA